MMKSTFFVITACAMQYQGRLLKWRQNPNIWLLARPQPGDRFWPNLTKLIKYARSVSMPNFIAIGSEMAPHAVVKYNTNIYIYNFHRVPRLEYIVTKAVIYFPSGWYSFLLWSDLHDSLITSMRFHRRLLYWVQNRCMPKPKGQKYCHRFQYRLCMFTTLFIC